MSKNWKQSTVNGRPAWAVSLCSVPTSSIFYLFFWRTLSLTPYDVPDPTIVFYGVRTFFPYHTTQEGLTKLDILAKDVVGVLVGDNEEVKSEDEALEKALRESADPPSYHGGKAWQGDSMDEKSSSSQKKPAHTKTNVKKMNERHISNSDDLGEIKKHL